MRIPYQPNICVGKQIQSNLVLSDSIETTTYFYCPQKTILVWRISGCLRKLEAPFIHPAVPDLFISFDKAKFRDIKAARFNDLI